MVTSAPPMSQPIEEPEPNPNPFETILNTLVNIRNRTNQLQFQTNSQHRIQTVEYHKDKFLDCFQKNNEQIESLIECQSKEETKEGPARAFDFTKIKHQIGQWLDVKDNMGNWLEAQIIDLQENKALIHYNGWGENWNEWIVTDSPRIALFRSHTIQAPGSIFNSFYPQVPPITSLATNPINFDKNLKLFEKSMETLQNMMKSFSNMEEEPNHTIFQNDKKILAAQISPLLDRMGRVMVDLSRHFSYIAYKEHCTENDKVIIPRIPEGMIESPSNGLTMECQIGISPNPQQIEALRNNQRDNGRIIEIQNIIVSRVENEPRLPLIETNPPEINVQPNDPHSIIEPESSPLLECNETHTSQVEENDKENSKPQKNH